MLITGVLNSPIIASNIYSFIDMKCIYIRYSCEIVKKAKVAATFVAVSVCIATHIDSV